MTGYTYDENIVSDLHKDAYGSRPSQWWWERWNASTDDQKQGQWDRLVDAVGEEIERDRQAALAAQQRFEEAVSRVEGYGLDRVQAMHALLSEEEERYREDLGFAFFRGYSGVDSRIIESYAREMGIRYNSWWG